MPLGAQDLGARRGRTPEHVEVEIPLDGEIDLNTLTDDELQSLKRRWGTKASDLIRVLGDFYKGGLNVCASEGGVVATDPLAPGAALERFEILKPFASAAEHVGQRIGDRHGSVAIYRLIKEQAKAGDVFPELGGLVAHLLRRLTPTVEREPR